MLRMLLSDRLHLAVHREPRETSVYTLSLDRGGLRIKPVSVAADSSASPIVSFIYDRTGRIHVEGKMPLSRLASILNSNMDRRVVDRTGAEGYYDIQLDAKLPVTNVSLPNNASTPPAEFALPNGKKISGDAPEIFSEIRKLGLQLTPAKLPVDYLVIDRIDRDPAEN